MSPLDRPRAQAGMSLIEVMIAVMLLSTLMAATFSVLSSVLKADDHVARASDERRVGTQALAEITRDLRRASEIVPPSSSRIAADELEMVTLGRSSGEVAVRFVIDRKEGELVRLELDRPGGEEVSRRRLLGDLSDEIPGAFRYYAADGRELLADGMDPKQLASCTVRVEVSVTVRPAGGAADTLESGATFRDVRPEEVQC